MRIVSLALVVLALTPRIGTSADDKSPRILILTGANNHKWQETTPFLKKLLEEQKFVVDVVDDPSAPILSEPEKLKGYGAILLNFNHNKRWGAEREKNFLDYVKSGGGIVVVHAANNAFDGWEDYDRLVGGTWRSRGSSFPERGTFHPPYGEFEVEVTAPAHPIMKGVPRAFRTTDEKYTNLKLVGDLNVLAFALHDEKTQPMLFTLEHGKGRVFHTALGHDLNAMKNEQFQTTLIQGTRWAVGD